MRLIVVASKLAEESYGQLTFDLLGGIASQLTNLRGIDVMAYELIQNAEDSDATSMCIHVEDKGITIETDSRFRKCADRKAQTCSWKEGVENRLCDWHRIQQMSGGDKGLADPQSIGRFGIGFISVYQVTDTPIITSDGLSMKFDPSATPLKTVVFTDSEFKEGTSLFLPWALDPNTKARKKFLSAPIIEMANLDAIAKDFGRAAMKAILFLNTLEKIEVYKHEEKKYTTEVKNLPDNIREIILGPTPVHIKWLIFRNRDCEQLIEIENQNTSIANQNRKRSIEIAILLSGLSDIPGQLYAFLPTAKTFEFSIQVNGDFFPDASRKTIIFEEISENDATAKWNQAIIESAASLFASKLLVINEILSPVDFWKLLSGARKMYENRQSIGSEYPQCYSFFWTCIQDQIKKFDLVLCEDGSKQKIEEVVIAIGQKLPEKRKVLTEFSLAPIAAELKQFEDLLRELGANDLNLSHIVNAAPNCAWLLELNSFSIKSDNDISQKYLPLWDLLNDLIITTKVNEATQVVDDFKRLKLFLTNNCTSTSISESKFANTNVDIHNVSTLFENIGFMHEKLSTFKAISVFGNRFDLPYVLSEIEIKLRNKEIPEKHLHSLYLLLNQVIHTRVLEEDEKSALAGLAIWPSTTGRLISALNAKVPGDFIDPLGIAGLIDMTKISKAGATILGRNLEIEYLTIENYVIDILPDFFDSDSTGLDPSNFKALLQELANHPRILTWETTLSALKRLRFIPTISGILTIPAQAIITTAESKEILGEGFSGWIDLKYQPHEIELLEVLRKIGVKSIPAFSDILQFWERLVNEQTPSQAKQKVSQLATYMAVNRINWNDPEMNEYLKLSDFNNQRRFPAKSDPDLWHSASDLYSPEWAETISTCADALILDITNENKSVIPFLEVFFGIKSHPEVTLLIRQIRNLRKTDSPPSKRFYTLLERLIRADSSGNASRRLAELREEPFIFLDGKYHKPARLFLNTVHLGERFAQIDASFADSHRSLIQALEIHNDPNCYDVISLLFEISQIECNPETYIGAEIGDTYQRCLMYLDGLRKQERIDKDHIDTLTREKFFLTRKNVWVSIYEAVIPDSDWFDSKFIFEFDDYLFAKTGGASEFLEFIGARPLSASVVSRINSAKGKKTINFVTRQEIEERSELISVVIAKMIENTSLHITWQSINVYDVSKIETAWSISNEFLTTPEVIQFSDIYFDNSKWTMYLDSTVINQDLATFWLDVFNEILSQLLPTLGESVIKSNTMVIKGLMTSTYEQGRSQLEHMKYQFNAIAKSKLEDFSSSPIVGQNPIDTDQDGPDVPGEGDQTDPQTPADDQHLEIIGRKLSLSETEFEDLTSITRQKGKDFTSGEEGTLKTSTRDSGGEPADGSETSSRIPRGVHHGGKSGTEGLSTRVPSESDQRANGRQKPKNQEVVRHAYIYTIGGNTEESSQRRAVRLENEDISRDYVMEFEKKEGRSPVPMSQTHPGYDIESTEQDGSEIVRFIEVKSTSGFWGAEGVDISITQIKKAYEKGENFWLYIVENVQSSNRKLHTIQNPAKYIKAFKFNDAWKELSESLQLEVELSGDVKNPADQEDIGCEIFHKSLGPCILIDWILRGTAVEVILRFPEYDEDIKRPYDPRLMKKING